jgi:hypothetical protein
MQPSSGRTDQLRQPAFDIHVDVFERAFEIEFAGVHLSQDRIETLC